MSVEKPDMGSPKMPEKENSKEQKRYEELINSIKEIFEPLPQGLGSCVGCEGSDKLTKLLTEKMTKEEIILIELVLTFQVPKDKRGEYGGEYGLISDSGDVGCGSTAGSLINALEFIEKRLALEDYEKFKSIKDLHDKQK